MTTSQTISWIFFATVLASLLEPSNYRGISSIADGLNHAVPTHKELQTSLSWLVKHDFVEKTGTKYSVTQKGIGVYKNAKADTENRFVIWKKLEEVFEAML